MNFFLFVGCLRVDFFVCLLPKVEFFVGWLLKVEFFVGWLLKGGIFLLLVA